jgi:predicted nucleotidyltransferase
MVIGDNPSMRLTTQEQSLIKTACLTHFGEPVRLFGSRLDESKRGGDIDLYIECSLDAGQAFDKELAMTADIWQVLGERKIDLVVSNGKHLLPIHERACREGVWL